MATPLLELRHVTKSFGGARALRGVDFDLMAGEVHALLGENGAGKSTLIKIVTGAHAPDGGTLHLEGRPLTGLNPRSARAAGIACIYQQPALFPDLTVAENIALRLESPPPFSRLSWRSRQERAHALLSRVGAAIDPATDARDLSMPQQQLVEIACAVGSDARIVIMDEPTASLTRQEQERLFDVVRELRARDVGVIYISHRLEEIFTLADRVTVLRDGASVGTHAVGAIDEPQLIHLMVGREVSQIYPPSEAEPGPVRLSLRGVSCATGGIHGVSLDVRAGEVVGLAGLVGAGRTELARVLFGLTPADAGEIIIDDARVHLRSPQDAIAAGIAYVPEDRRQHGVILELPIEANAVLAIQRRLFPTGWVSTPRIREVARHYIQSLAIKCTGPEAPTGSLSGGNQQKVALARWLATQPRVLLLDEPTQGVDVGAKSEIHRIIRQLAHEGVAVLLISSDLPEVIGMSDRIVVMRNGSVAQTLPGKTDPAVVMASALGQRAAG